MLPTANPEKDRFIIIIIIIVQTRTVISFGRGAYREMRLADEMASTLPERPFASPTNGSLHDTHSQGGASIMAEAMAMPPKRRLDEEGDLAGESKIQRKSGIPFSRRPMKKRRRSSKYHHRKPIFPSHIPPPSPLTLPGLPFELIAQICLHMHPRDILSLTRTNTWLCHTLVDPSAAFIWRTARTENCWRVGNGMFSWDAQPSGALEPMPDPTPTGITEPAYAALVFDDGTCDVS